jgi:hypothetical protein
LREIQGHWRSIISNGAGIVRLAFILAVMASCAWASWKAVVPIVDTQAAQRWPVVVGTVVASRVEIGCGRGGAHFPSVRYAYRYAGQSHVGSQIAFGNVGCGSVSDAEEVIRNYPVGANVQVHVNPLAAGTSVLMAGAVFSGTWWTLALLSGLLTALMFAAVREWPRKG